MSQTLPRDAQVTWVNSHDTDAAHEFYHGVLALQCVLERGGCRIYRVTDSAYIGVCKAGGAREVEPRGTLVTIVTEDVDAWYAHLVAHDVSVDGAPQSLPQYGIYAFFATGPDGYRLEFQRFDDPDWNAV